MTNTAPDGRPNDAIDSWYFDAKPDLVPIHLEARAMQRKVLFGCAIVGIIGVAILIAVIAGRPMGLVTASSLRL